MPELPEVETIIRDMREIGLVGAEIERVSVFWDRTIASHTSTEFCKEICGQVILDIDRRGKHLVFSLTRYTLIVHLRMTGKFFIDTQNTIPHKHERIRLNLKDGRVLRFEDQRKFGKWYLTSAPEKILGKIGVEPLSQSFTAAALKKLLKGRNRSIKPLLLDQQFVAGLGNIYVDEALWMAKIHPSIPASSLKEHEITALHKAIVTVLQSGIDNTGTSLGENRGNYATISGRQGTNQNKLNVFRRTGLPCTRCGTSIQKCVIAQRGTHFCPTCQQNK